MSDLKATIIQMGLNTKLSGRQIAIELGCTGAYVTDVLRQAGVDRGRRIEWEMYRETIEEMLKRDARYIDIARELDVNPVSLRYWMTKNGLLKKKKGGAVEPRVEIKKVNYDGKILNDVTDLMIERPCVIPTELPEWKKENQERYWESQGRYGINYGYYKTR